MPRKILLADDSVTAQNMGKKILSDAGYEVVTVSNGSAALKKANELKPDIVVLDVYMPGYSGLEVCKILKENSETADLPVLLTVGKLEPFKSEEALKARANAFIVKPFEATELLAVIRKIEDANTKAEKKPAKAPKASAPNRAFAGSTADAPEAQEAGIEEKGWKNRLGMPGKKKASAEPADADPGGQNLAGNDVAARTGTGFRDLTEPAMDEATLRRESAFTADAMPAQAPETAVVSPAEAALDISPEEIAAIKAAVEVLSGEGDRAPMLHVAADGLPRQLAPEPEETSPEEAPPEEAPEESVAERISEPQLVASVPEVVPQAVPVAAATHWVAEGAELTQSEASASLEREMQEALGTGAPAETFNTYSLANFVDSAAPEPVDDEPIVSEVAAAEAIAMEQATTHAVAEAPAALAASASGESLGFGSAGFQDLRPVASAAGVGVAPDVSNGSSGAPSRDTSAPDDEIDSRTKSQMNAAWTNWREIRNTLVTPNLTEQLAEVAATVATEELTHQPASLDGGHDAASIASIVDSVLAEMRPKLVEEIARKLAAKKD